MKNSPVVAISLEKAMAPHSSLFPGKSHGWRSLVGFSPWGHEESDMTEWLHFQFSLSCIGEGNGSPLQCSCLENPRDRWAWWAAVCGITQSQTWLKWLSSSSSSHILIWRKFAFYLLSIVLRWWWWRLWKWQWQEQKYYRSWELLSTYQVPRTILSSFRLL